MEITDVRIKLAPRSQEKLRAFATIVIDNAFVVHDLKIIERGKDRGLFLAMPSWKKTEKCKGCGNKNPVHSRYCSNCGKTCASRPRSSDDSGTRRLLNLDIAHPINAEARATLEDAVFAAYDEECRKYESSNRQSSPAYSG